MSQNEFYKATETGSMFIKHDGVKDMKWGRRRYQNEDGTWTEEGLARRRAQYEAAKPTGWRKVARAANMAAGTAAAAGSFGAATIATASSKENAARAFKPGKDGKPSPYSKAAGNSRDIIDETKKIDRILSENSNKPYTDDLTNKELQDMISRLRLEKDYRDLVVSDIKSGRDRAKDFLEIAGGLATVGLSVVSIIQLVRSIKGKE